MARKYTNYTIKITYLNGDTEDITLKGINTSSYKAMIKVYNDVKGEHEKDSCIIDFIGVSKTGELGILFTKEIKVETNDTEKLKMNTEDVVLQMQDLLEILVLKKEYLNNNQGAYDKKQNKKLHDLQFCKGDDEKLLKIAKELQDVRDERMKCKNELLYLNSFGVESMLNKIKKANECINNIKSGEKYSEETISNYNIMKEVTYKTEKERINLMKLLKPRYEKAVVDEVNKKITFYNNGYTAKKNKKAM